MLFFVFSLLFLLFQNFTPISFGQMKDRKTVSAQNLQVPYYLRDYTYKGENHPLNQVAHQVHKKSKRNPNAIANPQKGFKNHFNLLNKKAWSLNYTGDIKAEMGYYSFEKSIKVKIEKALDYNLNLNLLHNSKDKSSTINIGKDW